jgi:hypothetical protein
MATNEPLYSYRDMVSELFNLTLIAKQGTPTELKIQFDKLLDKLLEVYDNRTFKETTSPADTKLHVVVEKTHSTPPHSTSPHLQIRELGEATLFEPAMKPLSSMPSSLRFHDPSSFEPQSRFPWMQYTMPKPSTMGQTRDETRVLEDVNLDEHCPDEEENEEEENEEETDDMDAEHDDEAEEA